ncbi:MAG: flagellar basal body rod C-terminal domain-containing protein, partial [Anaeromyxobacteraceae bacterium]
ARAVAGLDGFAADLAAKVNEAHAAGVAPDGSTGEPLFVVDPNGRTAATIAVTLEASHLATGAPGGSPYANNAQALVATEADTLDASGATAAATLSAITAEFGASAARAEAHAGQETALRDHLSALREAASGVSIDEEMIQMQQAQRSYEAITKVIQVADSMLDTLMKLR